MLNVQTNLDTANAKTSTIVVVPNEPYPQTSTLNFQSVVTLDTTESVSIQVFDEFSNPIIVEQPVLMVVEGQGQTIFSTFIASSASEYATTYQIQSGTADKSNCGSYTLSNFLLIQGGLNADYYTNKYYAGEPYLQR